ncbi:HK97 family phage prohead protease [Paremcibacter congregatus]|uniref:HK97 family phage prohead protease n=1 Tax=Paremcibacter congregatus TaxID=2043170 RepID=A0A2G4YRL3_9PROT|nr:HK97 family phage prohead protease [Paremcibacter congregatus]PHZ84900.1 HK97 family phage prohead protease [Paremcibacter congregatus]QDE26126.1 HK97 family phage prohead protease [Paremcibacter congregatus]
MKNSLYATPDIKADVMTALGHFAGYASIFHVVDRGRDLILPGAFQQSLKDRGAAGVKLLWQHDPKEPVGVIDELREDGRGLYVRGRLMLQVARARAAADLLAAGALDGLSIGFHTVESDQRSDGVRLLRRVDLWEISLVTFPMNEQARISHFKSAAQQATETADLITSLTHLTQLMTPLSSQKG